MDLSRESLFLKQNETINIPAEDFPKVWMGLSNIWKMEGGKRNLEGGDYSTAYVCRMKNLTKSQTFGCSSDGPAVTRRAKSMLAKDLCDAKLHVKFVAKNNSFQLKFKAMHQHTLRDVDIIKIPVPVVEAVQKEVLKPYGVADIKNCVKRMELPGAELINRDLVRYKRNKLAPNLGMQYKKLLDIPAELENLKDFLKNLGDELFWKIDLTSKVTVWTKKVIVPTALQQDHLMNNRKFAISLNFSSGRHSVQRLVAGRTYADSRLKSRNNRYRVKAHKRIGWPLLGTSLLRDRPLFQRDQSHQDGI